MTQTYRHLPVMLCLCLLCTSGTNADPVVFHDTEVTGELVELVNEFRTKYPVKRYRIVTVDSEPLRSAISRFEQPGASPDCCPVSFQLFEDTTVTLYTFNVRAELLEKWIWMGRDSLEDDASKLATLTIGFGDTAQGQFFGLGARIGIKPFHSQGAHVIWEAAATEKRVID